MSKFTETKQNPRYESAELNLNFNFLRLKVIIITNLTSNSWGTIHQYESKLLYVDEKNLEETFYKDDNSWTTIYVKEMQVKLNSFPKESSPF